MIRQGHAWLFSDSIRKQNRAGTAGELAVIYDRRDEFLAIGLYDPHSPIRVRILHRGKPATLDLEWWRQRFRQCLERRRGMFDEQTTGFRCCNGESDGWPGLVLDRYDTTLVLKLYTAAWFVHLPPILDLIERELPNARIVLRLSRNIQSIESKEWQDGKVIRGKALDSPVVFRESSIAFEADVLRGQKTGFFLDQRENRRLAGQFSPGRRVLNAFSFSGGFSLYAARNGAAAVTDIDISAHALESARRNFTLNQDDPATSRCRHTTIQANVFDWLRDAPANELFDLVILDPPSLAKKEGDRVEAIQAYERLARRGMKHLADGGVLVAASCSAHVSEEEFFSAVRQAARKVGRGYQELQTTGHPPDHPATFTEARYLKCIYLRM